MVNPFTSLVNAWRELKDYFPSINHAPLAVKFRRSTRIVGNIGFNTARGAVHHFMSWDDMVMQPEEKVDGYIEHLYVRAEKRLQEIGFTIEDKIFHVLGDSRIGVKEGLISLREAADYAHLILARNYADRLKLAKISEADALNELAGEHLGAAGFDPTQDKGWQKIGMDEGVREACNMYVHLFRNLAKEFRTRLEQLQMGSVYAEEYAMRGSVLLEMARKHPGLKDAGLATPEAVFAVADLPSVEEVEREVRKYAVLFGERGIINRFAASYQQPGPWLTRELTEMTAILKDAGWRTDSLELWTILWSELPALHELGVDWDDFASSAAHRGALDVFPDGDGDFKYRM